MPQDFTCMRCFALALQYARIQTNNSVVTANRDLDVKSLNACDNQISCRSLACSTSMVQGEASPPSTACPWWLFSTWSDTMRSHSGWRLSCRSSRISNLRETGHCCSAHQRCTALVHVDISSICDNDT